MEQTQPMRDINATAVQVILPSSVGLPFLQQTPILQPNGAEKTAARREAAGKNA